MEKQPELKPCPFCGKPAMVVSTLPTMNYVVCSKMDRKHTIEVGPYRTMKMAVARWNKRKEE